MYLNGDEYNADRLVQAIVANGGKKLSGEYPEGEHGRIMYAEDSEGNRLGIYKLVMNCSEVCNKESTN